MSINLEDLCMNIPKAELHIHIEGTFEPELVVELAKKHGNPNFSDINQLKNQFKFTCLKDFLDLYYQCCDVLKDEDDFSSLVYSYIKKASSQGLKYAEIFFDPQTHTKRNIHFNTIMTGLKQGMKKGEEDFQVKSKLILCFLRDLPEEEALQTLKEAIKHKEDILGIGLDSNEFNNPPEKFRNVYSQAKAEGFRLVSHAGEECSIPVDYIYSALDVLNVERIDHGVQVRKCEKLMERIRSERIALTMCPLSNVKLQVSKDLLENPIKKFFDMGILVTINSDDPSYFGGYIGDNYVAVYKTFHLSLEEIVKFAKNSFEACFLNEDEKAKYKQIVDEYIKSLI